MHRRTGLPPTCTTLHELASSANASMASAGAEASNISSVNPPSRYESSQAAARPFDGSIDRRSAKRYRTCKRLSGTVHGA